MDVGVLLGSLWGPFGVSLGFFWVPLGSCWTLGSHWGLFEVSLGSFWGLFGVPLGSLWGPFGVSLGFFWGLFGVLLGSHWGPTPLGWAGLGWVVAGLYWAVPVRTGPYRPVAVGSGGCRAVLLRAVLRDGREERGGLPQIRHRLRLRRGGRGLARGAGPHREGAWPHREGAWPHREGAWLHREEAGLVAVTRIAGRNGAGFKGRGGA